MTTGTIREPQIAGIAHFSAEPPMAGSGLFPAGLLEVEDRFRAHIGYDQYLHIGQCSAVPAGR